MNKLMFLVLLLPAYLSATIIHYNDTISFNSFFTLSDTVSIGTLNASYCYYNSPLLFEEPLRTSNFSFFIDEVSPSTCPSRKLMFGSKDTFYISKPSFFGFISESLDISDTNHYDRIDTISSRGFYSFGFYSEPLTFYSRRIIVKTTGNNYALIALYPLPYNFYDYGTHLCRTYNRLVCNIYIQTDGSLDFSQIDQNDTRIKMGINTEGNTAPKNSSYYNLLGRKLKSVDYGNRKPGLFRLKPNK